MWAVCIPLATTSASATSMSWDVYLLRVATYMLFVHLRDENDEDPPGRNRPTPALLRKLFEPYFELKREELGSTQVEDKPVWNSGWYWWKRK